MPQRPPMLYIVFIRPDDESNPRLDVEQSNEVPWTAPKDAQPGDTALFYLGGAEPGICGIGRTAEEAELGEPGEWTESTWGYFAQHEKVLLLRHPITLHDIRRAFPTWKRWNNLKGTRVHIVPEDRCERLAEMVAARNSVARRFLLPWIEGERSKTR